MVPSFQGPWCTKFFLTLHLDIWAKWLRGELLAAGLMPSSSSPPAFTYPAAPCLPIHTATNAWPSVMKKKLLPAAEHTKNKLCQRSDWMFTFSVRIFPLILSRSWAHGLVIVLYKIYKEMDPGLARHKSLLRPSEETALFLFPVGLFFPLPVDSG